MGFHTEREWWEGPAVAVVEKQNVLRVGDIVHPDLDECFDNRARRLLVDSLTELHCQRNRFLGERVTDASPTIELHNVYMPLPRAIFESLKAVPFNTPQDEAHFRKQCLELIPEAKVLSIRDRDKGAHGGMNPNHYNVFYFDAQDWPFHEFSFNQQTAILQRLKAAYGSFKEIIVLCDPRAQVPIRSVWLSTLEGGRPDFVPIESEERNLGEFVRRMRVFASGRPVAMNSEFGNRRLGAEQWEQAYGVSVLHDLGVFAGQMDLISPPVNIRDQLIKDPLLGYFIVRVAGKSQQAEAMMYGYDPFLEIAAVTATGQFGTVKTNLQPEDIIARYLWGERSERVSVPQSDKKKGSVEEGEVVDPLVALAERYALRVIAQDNGFIPSSEGVKVPPLAGVFHNHRYPWGEWPNHAVFIEQDVNLYPPTGCGLDLTYTTTEHYVTEFLQQWHDGGRRLKYGLVEMANHGLHIVVPWTLNEQGVYPLDPFEQFKKDILLGRLTGRFGLRREIVQK